ncbi:MAG: DUF2785 domain-containing protein [Defluviitaleaceae bacterium]|nr:DUF2785 domain-containing protein [Defluviitaleaceae bacterium]
MELKDKLTKYNKMNSKVMKELSKEEVSGLIDDILENASTADTELRYELIYPTLSKMVSRDILSEKEFSRLLRACLDENNLFHGLGEKGTDSVFTRAFSSLILYTLLEANSKKQVLSVPEVDNAFEQILQYTEKEMDTRGFVEGKGWAFAIAHAADMLQCLVQTPLITMERFPDILAAVKSCLFKEGPYIDGEIDRLAMVAKLIMEKGFAANTLESWLQSLVISVSELRAEEGMSYKFYRINTNVMNFLRSLYFAFKKDGDRVKLRVSIYQLIKKF